MLGMLINRHNINYVFWFVVCFTNIRLKMIFGVNITHGHRKKVCVGLPSFPSASASLPASAKAVRDAG